MDQPAEQRHAQDVDSEHTAGTRLGSESDLTVEKTPGQEQMSVVHELTFIITICMAQIFALAGIGQGFGKQLGSNERWRAQSVSGSVQFTVGTFILPAGRLGDMYGHKKIFLIGAIWFGVWSLIAEFSVYLGTILFSVCRGFQGISPALMVPNALAIGGRSFQGEKKNYVFAFFGACVTEFVAGVVLGGLFVAIFSELVWWLWTYWVQGMILFVYMATSFLILPRDALELKEDGTKPTFDFAGTITGVSRLVLFNFAWNQAGVVGWTVPYTYILLIFAQQVPVAPSGLIASLAIGFFLSKMKVAYIMVAAMACFLIGQILIATTPVGQTYWAQTFVSLVIKPWGMDMSFPAGTIILSNGMPREHQGIAASLINTTVNYSISLRFGISQLGSTVWGWRSRCGSSGFLWSEARLSVKEEMR
ncbi:related to Drug resistance protein YOR378W [Phialocephala subalpina]|uniref:Related to Drug resistance protein YOR378W n=1 Tax=Phialocephala subalpina TaxID=576137 RepID=A0A1L7WSY4_9HELO|nr:related to Drug resistance protein YOR378W [Phialocephala subalpina]